MKLSGILDFVDDKTLTGFQGEGKLEIEGLPPLAAAFAFMRARHNETSPWQRTWFIYLEASQISLEIPKIKQYIREIGLGFGYRYTLVSIKVADEADDIADLLYRLRELSRTQGDLAKLDRWAIDLEEPGEDLRWTIVLRAMLSQMSANKSPLVYDAAKEKNLANVYLLDVVAALRSDLTFFMAVRGWITANYMPEIHQHLLPEKNPSNDNHDLVSLERKNIGLDHAAGFIFNKFCKSYLAQGLA